MYKRQGYDRWAAKHNLKQMAATVTAYQQYGFSSPEELDEACSAAYAAIDVYKRQDKRCLWSAWGKRRRENYFYAYALRYFETHKRYGYF